MNTLLLLSVAVIVLAILVPKPGQRHRRARIDALLHAADRRNEPSPGVEPE